MSVRKRIRKIAVTGGKGGTGKSTVAVLLANKFFQAGKKVVLCDCDVECPNDFLLVGAKLGSSGSQGVFAEFPFLDKNKCLKCGLCVKSCLNHAIFQAPGKYPQFMKDLCSGCTACQIICPRGAISMKKEKVGQVFKTEIKKGLWLVTGQMKAGLEKAEPIVNQAKELALSLARKKAAEIIIFDTAAGIHCPVISALRGCDLAYAVTEPSPMGAYDLKLILELCRKLKINAKIIINRSDLATTANIEKLALKFKIDIEKKIPHQKDIVKLSSLGKLLDINF